MRSFRATPASTVNIAVAASTTTPLKVSGDQDGPTTIRVFNSGTATAWIEFGNSAVVAVLATSIPVPAGVVELFTVQSAGGPLYVATIAAGATGAVYFTPGQGI